MTELKKTRSELKREAIIKSAMQAFQEFGVNSTSMDKIAEMAEVSKRTVYNHFSSKEQLVTHIIQDIWQSNIAVFDFSYQPDKPLDEQLLILINNELNIMCCPQISELIRVAMGYCMFNAESMQENMAQFFQQETALKRWIKAAQDDRRLKVADVNTVNEQIIGLLKGQAFWPQFMRIKPALTDQQIVELGQSTVAMILGYYQLNK
jgi:TetR/AcrR family transcriptional regulator, regulator of autoinduction and epiphytic fitness